MSARDVRLAIVAALLVATLGVQAQQPPAKTPRIAFLAGGSRAGDAPFLEAFWRRMKELGYVEGRNIIAEYRFAEGVPGRLPVFAAELVHLKVDVIVGPGSGAVAAKKATDDIPIVVTLGDPVGAKLATSFARPGGNVTGLSTQLPELRVKQLDLLKEALPKMSRVAVIVQKGGSIAFSDELRQLEIGAAKLHVAVQRVEISDAGDLERAFSAIAAARTDALLTIRTPLTVVHKSRIIEFAASSRIPAIYSDEEFTAAGGLMSYGVNVPDLWARAATYVDRILKGARPANLPIAQPEKFDLVINLKTAKALGVAIPKSVLQRADRVIE